MSLSRAQDSGQQFKTVAELAFDNLAFPAGARSIFTRCESQTCCEGEKVVRGDRSELAESLSDFLDEPAVSSCSSPPAWYSPQTTRPLLRIVRGCDWDRFNASEHHAVTTETFSVSPDSDRMGVRF